MEGEGGRTLSKAPALQQGKPSPTLEITISILNSKLSAVYAAVTNKIIDKQNDVSPLAPWPLNNENVFKSQRANE